MSVAFDRAAVFEAGMPACSSSSLGKDSDDGSAMGKEEERDGEVQSAYTGLNALEESLPIRRGISKFYNGKSRSFTFLRDAITPSGSSRDIAKAENAYTRKRKNLLAYSIMYDKSQQTALETNESGSRKRLASWSSAPLNMRPLASISSSRSSSSSSISSEENELPQEFSFGQSPDNTARTIPVSRLGSCASKTLSAPAKSRSMLDLHRLQRSWSSVRLKDKLKVE
ncbi:hypothetical protein EJB05_43217 [Eragrostis curvula]|uniref:Uncharacterized protein n=1 Tax=Eragrostis curvula TaxID=38414 RepID=A0A5J9TEI6_9POAL|nr:hypothetical protein EJB05_43217 [Eragrostis curvula]